ncbi:MAG: hypothetical protein FWD34_02285 [Oscillospiraceae bacterium]|nr:hypothetical protein [Oscillospiraceae bacterium]
MEKYDYITIACLMLEIIGVVLIIAFTMKKHYVRNKTIVFFLIRILSIPIMGYAGFLILLAFFGFGGVLDVIFIIPWICLPIDLAWFYVSVVKTKIRYIIISRVITSIVMAPVLGYTMMSIRFLLW